MKSQVLLGLAVVYFAQSLMVPALADQPQAGTGSYKVPRLQKVEPYMARPQIELLDESPIFKDRRPGPQQQQVYEIAVPPVPQGGAAAGQVTGGPRPGVIRVTPNQDGRILAPAGFQSNVPAKSPLAGKQLPPGVTTGIHAKIDRPIAATTARPPGSLLKAARTQPTATTIKTYQPISVGTGTGSSGRQTSQDVKGVLKKGSLLK